MKIIKDTNFLNGGNLEILIDHDKNFVYGQYAGYREDLDEFIHYQAAATCSKNDSFKEKEGIDIVKLKIARRYYSDILKLYKKYKRDLLKDLQEIEQVIDYSDKKLNNILTSLEDDYELIYNLRKYKKNRKKKNKLNIDINKLKNDRKSGLTYKELANKYKCSETTVKKYCK